MEAKITFDVGLDPTSLGQAARIIAALQNACAGYESPSATNPTTKSELSATAPGKPEDFVERWLKRLGSGSRKFWKLTAQYAINHNFFITFEDLSSATNIKVATLRSYHRNSYRAINDEKAPDPMPGVWSGATKRYEYAMGPLVRDKILELTKIEPKV